MWIQKSYSNIIKLIILAKILFYLPLWFRSLSKDRISLSVFDLSCLITSLFNVSLAQRRSYRKFFSTTLHRMKSDHNTLRWVLELCKFIDLLFFFIKRIEMLFVLDRFTKIVDRIHDLIHFLFRFYPSCSILKGLAKTYLF